MNLLNVESDERAVSPVVGVALLIGITVILAAVIGSVVLGAGVGPAGAPQVTLSFELTEDEDEIALRHEGGDRLDADEVVILNEAGVTVGGLDSDLHAGQRRPIVDDPDAVERISVVWQDPRSDSESVLATFKS